MSRDNLYSLPRERVGQFQFDADVANVFPDMISRSVPGYASILSVIEQLAGRFVLPGTNVYDLGCSLGAATLLIRNQAPADVSIHAVDNSAAMIDRLRDKLDADAAAPDACEVHLQLADICDVAMNNASMIVLNFTLQFVPAEKRRGLLQSCFDALLPGGGLVISEKVCFDDPGQQSLLTELHLDFKRACGYSELEIAQKRTSLENTLIPESIAAHSDRLTEIGFSVVAPWFQCFNFASILAVK
ncbi:tRNA (cmo5U34)-methyltransferase [Stieleria maiorica]|uniref:Carboxy-S-adenosyl-L-methionine synthase n=1 Tax=Stieleria maiorica TaxID=2795974 RepID=A0A5B9MFX9_9BACT|nr:carboxy-S-adenosyl-L-methionine synthase CmoA [Stieleria maiorica]QEG00069.1 tRNA (cmo5U34)-methyltransferase [Stieleria maiorica]